MNYDVYDYRQLENDLSRILEKCPFITYEVIGNSVEGRNIYAIRLGGGKRELSYNGSHHGSEWITSKLLMKFIDDWCDAYRLGTRLGGYDIRGLADAFSIYVVPMVNPDGVELAKTVETWQANANGVDINHNYDAGWEEYRALAEAEGYNEPGPTRYPGPFPESEPETRAMVEFTRSKNFEYVIALHSQGEVIYWQFDGFNPPEARRIAERIAESTGYLLDETTGLSSYSGYKDWFIKEFNRPGFTVEVGFGKNPLPLSQFDGIYDDILEMLVFPQVL